jgi:sec-independent protein translocase protein TatA
LRALFSNLHFEFSKDEFMIGKLGLPELAVILGIALLILGPSKLGELGKSFGEGIHGFKSALADNDPAVKKP